MPRSSLDRLADAGLYGLTGPVDAGGAAANAATVAAVVEELAAGDLATTFVWLQHLGVVGRLATSGSPQLRSTFLADLCAGRLRAGIALQAAVRPGPPAIRARRDGAELVLDGAVPWVTGWGLVDLLLVAARDGDDVAFVLVDAEDGPTLGATTQPMVAVAASRTVELRLTGHRVPAERLVQQTPLADLLAGDAAGLRLNGSLALGLALRCTRLIGPSPLDGELAAVRAGLDAAGPQQRRSRTARPGHSWPPPAAPPSAPAPMPSGRRGRRRSCWCSARGRRSGRHCWHSSGRRGREAGGDHQPAGSRVAVTAYSGSPTPGGVRSWTRGSSNRPVRRTSSATTRPCWSSSAASQPRTALVGKHRLEKVIASSPPGRSTRAASASTSIGRVR